MADRPSSRLPSALLVGVSAMALVAGLTGGCSSGRSSTATTPAPSTTVATTVPTVASTTTASVPPTSTPSTSGAPSTSTAAPPAGGTEADRRVAATELLVLSDLPAGWRQDGTVWLGVSTSSSAAKSFSAPLSDSPDLARCTGVAAAPAAVAGEAGSPTFTDIGDTLLVDDAADVYATVATAQADFPPVSRSAFPRCFLEEFRPTIVAMLASVSGAGSAVGTPVAGSKAYRPYGDQSGAVEVSAPVTVSGDTYTEYIDFLFIRHGRSVTTLTLNSSDAPFPVALAEQLGMRVLAKMAAAG